MEAKTYIFAKIVEHIWKFLKDNSFTSEEMIPFRNNFIYSSKVEILENATCIKIQNTGASPGALKNLDLADTALRTVVDAGCRYWFIRYSSFLELYILEGSYTLGGLIHKLMDNSFKIQLDDSYITESGIIDMQYGVVDSTTKAVMKLVERFPKLEEEYHKLIVENPTYVKYNEIEADFLRTPLKVNLDTTEVECNE